MTREVKRFKYVCCQREREINGKKLLDRKDSKGAMKERLCERRRRRETNEKKEKAILPLWLIRDAQLTKIKYLEREIIRKKVKSSNLSLKRGILALVEVHFK